VSQRFVVDSDAVLTQDGTVIESPRHLQHFELQATTFVVL
jgi:hypothetical protein